MKDCSIVGAAIAESLVAVEDVGDELRVLDGRDPFHSVIRRFPQIDDCTMDVDPRWGGRRPYRPRPLHSPSTGAKFAVVTPPDAAATALWTFRFTDLEVSTRSWERRREGGDGEAA